MSFYFELINSLDWNVLNTTPLRWNRFARTCLANQDRVAASTESVVLSGTIPHLEFTLEMQSNNLTYQGLSLIHI